MSKLIKRVLAIGFAATLALATTGWAEEEAADDSAAATVDAAPPTDADTEGAEGGEEAAEDTPSEE